MFRKNAGVLIGGNFAVRRSTLEKIGGPPKLNFWGDDATIAMLISRQVGKVCFDPNLKVESSPRRFERNGFFALTVRYAIAYFKFCFSPDFR